MSGEWKSALRLQIEALAKRNDLHRKSSIEEIRKRTVEMDQRIVRLRELVSSSANEAALFYLECVCHADESERILNRSSSVLKKKGRKKKRPTVVEIQPHPPSQTISSLPSVVSFFFEFLENSGVQLDFESDYKDVVEVSRLKAAHQTTIRRCDQFL